MYRRKPSWISITVKVSMLFATKPDQLGLCPTQLEWRDLGFYVAPKKSAINLWPVRTYVLEQCISIKKHSKQRD